MRAAFSSGLFFTALELSYAASRSARLMLPQFFMETETRRKCRRCEEFPRRRCSRQSSAELQRTIEVRHRLLQGLDRAGQSAARVVERALRATECLLDHLHV